MATKTRPWTRADLDRLPDDSNRYEVLDGALLVTPLAAFDHQDIATALAVRLRTYCDAYGIGTVVTPGAVPHRDSELQPDILVVPGPRPARGTSWAALPRPLLVVEVLSDSTRPRDLLLKRDAYMRWEIPEYWIVDQEERVVLVVRPECEDQRVTGVLSWQPRADVPAFTQDIQALFG